MLIKIKDGLIIAHSEITRVEYRGGYTDVSILSHKKDCLDIIHHVWDPDKILWKTIEKAIKNEGGT